MYNFVVPFAAPVKVAGLDNSMVFPSVSYVKSIYFNDPFVKGLDMASSKKYSYVDCALSVHSEKDSPGIFKSN